MSADNDISLVVWHLDLYSYTSQVEVTTVCKSSLVNSLRPSDAYIRQLTNITGSNNTLSPGRRQAIREVSRSYDYGYDYG